MTTKSVSGPSKGGKSRARNLSRAERSAIARKAALARWGDGPTPRAAYSGVLEIGDVHIPCAVLENETRILTQEGFLMAIGRSGKPAAGRGSQVEKVAPFLDLVNLKSFVDLELADSTKPIIFRVPSGGRAYGYKAELLPRVCEVYLRARDAGALLKTQEKFAAACDLLMRALAHVGIVALVDEATGYQAERERDALARILEAFVSKELKKWVKTFPPEYYRELCRLKDVEYPPRKKTFPQYFGHLTNDIVYDRLAPGVKDELQRRNPIIDHRYRRHKHHQHLTRDIGHPALREHLWAATALMKASDDWHEFKRSLDRALPVQIDVPMPLWEDQGLGVRLSDD